MNKVTHGLVRADLLLIVRHWDVFRLSLINPLLPDLLISVNSVWKLFEEH
jgi:hypothetical protein